MQRPLGSGAQAPVKYLIVECHQGLGNRIRALVAGRRLARLMNRQLGVVWTMDKYHCCCDYGSLFSTTHLLLTDHFYKHANWLERCVVSKSPNYLEVGAEADVIHVKEDNFFWAVGDQGVMWGQYGPDRMTNSSLRDELLAEFEGLRPSHTVDYLVRKFTEAHFQGPIVGLHARREDNIWSNAYCFDDDFVRAAGAALLRRPGAKLFVATDSAVTENRLSREFGDTCVTYPVRSFDRGGSWQAIQDAFVVMLLLAKTQLIIRSCSSTFSQCAAWFGRVPTIEIGELQHVL
jgi:hypothetical protein